MLVQAVEELSAVSFSEFSLQWKSFLQTIVFTPVLQDFSDFWGSLVHLGTILSARGAAEISFCPNGFARNGVWRGCLLLVLLRMTSLLWVKM